MALMKVVLLEKKKVDSMVVLKVFQKVVLLEMRKVDSKVASMVAK